MRKLKWDDGIGIALFLISTGLLCVSVFLCFSSDIWYDELFTMGLGNQSLGDLISITAQDVHPPFYYMLVKLALVIAGAVSGSVNQVVIAKLVSVLPFFLCEIYAVTVLRKYFSLLTGGLFCFLILTMPNLSGYTVEIRMYGYAIFFITAGMIHAFLICKNQSGQEISKKENYVNWIMLAIYALAACYTHYFACVAACMVFVYVLIDMIAEHKWKKLWKPFLLCSLVCIAGYLPWLLTVVTSQVEQVSSNYWIQPLSIRTLGGCIKYIFMPVFQNQTVNVVFTVILAGGYAILMLYFICRDIKRKENKQNRTDFTMGCVGILAGIVAFGFLASFLIRPIFVYRYMLPAMGVFWLAFTIWADRIKKKKILFIPILIILVITGFTSYRSFYGEEMYKRVQMQNTQKALSQIEGEAILLYNFDQTQAVCSYYLPNESYLWYGTPETLIHTMYPQNKSLVLDFSDETGIEQIHKLLLNGKKLYFLGSGNAREEIIEKWKKAGINAQEEGDFLLERYWLRMYKITTGKQSLFEHQNIDDSKKKQ